METKSYSNAPVGADADDDEPAPASLSVVDPGRYVLGDEIARGGMGRVVVARDVRLDRDVAIKELLPEDRDRQLRFEREVRITAGLEHPAIIRVYEAGVWPDGKPFYAMPRVTGRSLDKVIAERSTLADRLGLLAHVIAAADALAYAHAKQVIHRDLKPANVLVGDFGETVVIDWGLAKRSADTDATTGAGPTVASVDHTVHGSVVGTPNYMPPEQARGEPVDARADVYSLGAMLYEVLAGTPPYPRGSPAEVLARVLDGPPTPIRRREPDVPRDLAAIVDKAMARDPAARYPDAAELVSDLKRFQTGQLVAARHYSPGQRVLRFVRRHAVVVGFATALVALGAISLVRISASRDQALAARAEASERNDELVLMQARAELARDPTSSLAWLKRYPPAAPGWSTALQISTDAWTRGVAHDVWDFGKPIGSLAFSPDSRTLAAGASDGTLTLVDVATGKRTTHRAADGVGDRVVFSPDGKWLATSDGRDHVRLWDRTTGTSRRLDGEQVGGPKIEFSPDGTLLLVRHINGGTRLWRVPNGEPVKLPGDDRRLVTFVGASHVVALALGEELSLYDVDTQQAGARTKLDGRVSDLSATPDGRWIAASRQDSLALWDPTTNAVRKIAAAKNVVILIIPSADSHQFMTCGMLQRELWRFDVDAGTSSRVSGDERCYFQAASFTPDGSVFLSAGLGGELRLHLLSEGQTRLLIGHQAAVTDAVFSPDGRLLASASTDRTVRMWRWVDGDVRVFHGLTAPADIAINGQQLVIDSSNAYSVIDVRSGKRDPVRDLPANVKDVAVSASGRGVGFLLDDPAVALYDPATRTYRTLPLHDRWTFGTYTVTQLTHDLRRLAQIDQSGVVRIADLESGTSRVVGHLRDIGYMIDTSVDGRLLAAGGRDGTARVIDIETGAERSNLACHGIVWGVAFSRDATKVAAACGDGQVRVLDLATRRVRELAGHSGAVASVDFTTDGGSAISSGVDGTVRIWNLASELGVIVHRAPGPIISTHFVGDTSLVLDRSEDARVLRLWDSKALPPLVPASATLMPWLAATTTAEVDPRGVLGTPE